jgi:iron complex outermembrane receptor protein
MDTGNVSGYSNCNSGMMGSCSMMTGTLNYARDSAAFNALSHAKTDVNFDAMASLHYDVSPLNAEEIGFARKTRSPNLYERYSWSTGGMAASMINWFGNGAEYVGNIDLKPEIANTISVSSAWHDAARQDWQVNVTPYYSYVQDYIGVNSLGSNGSTTPGIYLLQFANHDAEMIGFDISGKKAIVRKSRYGDVDIDGVIGLVKGWQVDNGAALYRMQPLSLSATLSHRLGSLDNALELRAVGGKSGTAPNQNEPPTPAFTVLNWRTSYKMGSVTVAAGIDNILNKQYYDPNGGVNVAEWRSMGTSYGATHGMGALPASGRSFNVGLTYAF